MLRLTAMPRKKGGAAPPFWRPRLQPHSLAFSQPALFGSWAWGWMETRELLGSAITLLDVGDENIGQLGKGTRVDVVDTGYRNAKVTDE